jgi:hypothetical protein
MAYFLEFQEQGEKGDISLKKEGKLEGQNMQKICISLVFVFCYIFLQFSNETESNVLIARDLPTLPPFAIYLPFLHLQSRKKNYDKEKTLKTVIISVFICFILYMVHSSGSHSKKSEQKWKGRKNTKTSTKSIGRYFLVFLQYIHESPS